MKERIEKGAKFYSERAYLQCFECITEKIENMKNKQDEDLNWALFQIASQGIFIIKESGITTQERLNTLRETLKFAKDSKDLAALLKSIAEEITT